ncbi:unnamed protein product [Moneuplotes crassus]|uniref:Uncharacterized protein n=1 Tax=Euplotes crassus TaxID=5936 RepID=A0AAD1XTJ4_EUPCR|nr:unnamed protein product [Moneuplotes crassus]
MEPTNSSAAYNYLPDDESEMNGEKVPYGPVDKSNNSQEPTQHTFYGNPDYSQPGMGSPINNIDPNPGFPVQNPQIAIGQPIIAGQPQYNHQFNNNPHFQQYPRLQMNMAGRQPVMHHHEILPNPGIDVRRRQNTNRRCWRGVVLLIPIFLFIIIFLVIRF